jgi:hypothetical protein
VIAYLSDFTKLEIDASCLRYQWGKLYLDLPNGLRAKFKTVAYYDLMNDLQEDSRYYYVILNGRRANLFEKRGNEAQAG